MNKIDFPFSDNLKIIFDLILQKGDEIRVVGGSVRDFILNHKISEIDLACKYLPEETISILNKNGIKTLHTGIKHGTVTAFVDNESFEITTLRIDKKTYGRKADVEFTDDFYLDAKRRDFTINAMSIDYSRNLYDYFGGLQDLNEKKVRFIGDPEQRIEEDYLRIMRFFRFSCYYGKDFDQKALTACVKYKNKITLLSSDRIRNELIKILNCKNKKSLSKTLNLINRLEILEPLTGKCSEKSYFDNLLFLEQESGLEFGILLKFFAFALVDKEDVANVILKKFNFSRKDERYLLDLSCNNLNLISSLDTKKLAFLLLDHQREFLNDALIIEIIENKEFINLTDVEGFLKIRDFINKTEIPRFPVQAKDLLVSNIETKDIKKLLRLMHINWIEENFSLTKEQILNDLIFKK